MYLSFKVMGVGLIGILLVFVFPLLVSLFVGGIPYEAWWFQPLNIIFFASLGVFSFGLVVGLGFGAIYLNKKRNVLGSEDKNAQIESLISSLREEENISHATNLLGNIGDERAVEPLIGILDQSKHENHVKEAVKALGKIGSKRAVEPLIGILDNEKYHSFFTATVDSLANIGDEKAVGPILEAFQRYYPQQRWMDPTTEPKFLRQRVILSLRRFENLDEKAVEPISELLRDEDWMIRSIAVEMLGKIGTPALKPLESALKDKSRSVRNNAKKMIKKVQSDTNKQ